MSVASCNPQACSTMAACTSPPRHRCGGHAWTCAQPRDRGQRASKGQASCPFLPLRLGEGSWRVFCVHPIQLPLSVCCAAVAGGQGQGATKGCFTVIGSHRACHSRSLHCPMFQVISLRVVIPGAVHAVCRLRLRQGTSRFPAPCHVPGLLSLAGPVCGKHFRDN